MKTTVSTVPKRMRAAVIAEAGPASRLSVKELPVPKLTRGHVIIALDYASVGPWDIAQRKATFGPVLPGATTGIDGSGIVVEAASDVKGFGAGDRVYAYSYANPHGGFAAEYVSVPATNVWHVPDVLDQRSAGAMPCAALTALSGLGLLDVTSGTRLLVYGAAGGVGSFAVWLAASLGATVIGAARADAHDYLRELGVSHAIDAYSANVETTLKRIAPEPFDALLAARSGETLPAFVDHLRPNAAFAYPNGFDDMTARNGHRAVGYDGEASPDAGARLNRALGAKAIPLRIETFDLDNIADAHRRLEQGHVLGKIVLQIHR